MVKSTYRVKKLPKKSARSDPIRRVSIQKRTKTSASFNPNLTGHCEVILRSPLSDHQSTEIGDKFGQTKVVKMQRRPSV